MFRKCRCKRCLSEIVVEDRHVTEVKLRVMHHRSHALALIDPTAIAAPVSAHIQICIAKFLKGEDESESE